MFTRVRLFFILFIFVLNVNSFAQIVNVWAENNFTAPNGSKGNLIVEGVERQTRWNYQVAHNRVTNLDAIYPQSGNDGYQRTWSLNRSTWNFVHEIYGQTIDNNHNPHVEKAILSAYNGGGFVANLFKICNRTFEINLPGIGNNYGTIYINGLPYASPKNFPNYIEGTYMQLTYQSDIWYNDIHFVLVGPASESKTFETNGTYTRYYNCDLAWPASTPRNLTLSPANQNPGANVRLTWTEYPSTSVTKYEIWRSSPTYGSSKIGEVNRGTTSFIDNQYFYSIPGGAQPEGVYYDVRAYFNGITSPADFVYTKLVPIQIIEKGNADNSSGVSEIKEYSITNYPNPFNPVTKIEYQVPNAGYTTVKVYSTLGKEVAVLVDEYKDGGKYTTEFNASDLPSGVYFYELRSGEYVQMKKMLLVK